MRVAILCRARRAAPVGGAVGRCGRGAGDPSLPPRFISLCASSSSYSFLSLSPSLSGSVPASLCFRYPSLRSLPLLAPACHCGAGDVTRADSLPRSSSLSPQSRMSSIQNLQSFGKSRRHPATPSANPPIAPGPLVLPPAPPSCLRLPEGRGPPAPAVTLSGVAVAAVLREAAPAARPCPPASPAVSGTCSGLCGEETSGGRLSPSLPPWEVLPCSQLPIARARIPC